MRTAGGYAMLNSGGFDANTHDMAVDRFKGSFVSLDVAVGQVVGAPTHQQGHLKKLFHDIDHTVVVARRAHAAFLIEFLVGHWHRRLIRNGEHAHPAPQQAQGADQGVDHVERLRAPTHLHYCQRAPLARARGTLFQRNPVDLVLHHRRHRSMTLRTATDLALGSQRQRAQLSHLGMVFGHAAGHGQLHRIENLHFRPRMLKDVSASLQFASTAQSSMVNFCFRPIDAGHGHQQFLQIADLLCCIQMQSSTKSSNFM